MTSHFDVVIIGSGAGGGTLARTLVEAGVKVLVLERGDWLPREPQNWDPVEVFQKERYVSADVWFDGQGRPFQPGSHYVVGGATNDFGFVEAAHTQIVTPTLEQGRLQINVGDLGVTGSPLGVKDFGEGGNIFEKQLVLEINRVGSQYHPLASFEGM